jgi:uncharacterized protein DUF2752
MKLPDLSFSISKAAFWVAASVLVATFLLQPDGYGFSICTFKNATGLDCFGCGMTRGVTSLTHMRVEAAWRYHPFAFVFWPLLITLAMGIIPPVGRRLVQISRSHGRLVNRLLWTAMLAFFVFGVVRLVFPAFWY